VYNAISDLAAEYGIEAAAEIAAFEAKHVHAIKDFIDKEKIECDYVVTKAVDVQLNESHCQRMRDGYERLIASGCHPTKEAQYVDKSNAEAVCRPIASYLSKFRSRQKDLIFKLPKFSGVKGATGCFTYDAGHIWPYKFVLHLLTKVLSRGVNLQTHTPVLQISETRDSTSGRWTVHTSRGSIAAKQVVFATNGYTSSVAPQYRDKIVPVRGTCGRIVAPKRPGVPRLLNTYTLRWNAWDYDYLIPRADGSIIAGGARSTYVHNPENWYNVTDDSRVPEAAVRYFDNYMQRNFRGWENSGAYTDRVWTGSKISSHKIPKHAIIPKW
jgi:hypothetical protein